jgi:Protein of unknown function (DUF669)
METINWAALIQDSADAFAILPKDTYRMQVVTAEATMSSTGKTMFKTKLQVINGPKTGSTVFNNITMTTDNPKALFMFFENMAALGVSREFLQQNPTPSPQQVAAKMVGAVADITIDHRPYNGVDRENVKGMKAVAGGAAAPSVGPAVPGVAVAAPSVSGAPVPSF